MKNYISSLLIGAAAMSLASCSDTYLDVAPESDMSSATVFATTEMLDGASNGLSLLMSESYSSSGFSRQGYNGEATISLWYGAYCGSDAQYSNMNTRSLLFGTNNIASTNVDVFYPWYYYYKLIANANAILLHADEASGAQTDKDFYKAQALTYRAHAYTQLAALYCKRWVDSRNGASRGLPIRLDDSTGEMACSSLADVYKQIYDDLDEALRLYNESGRSRGNAVWRTDKSVAHGIYSRAALARQDWATAANHAAEARKGYALMTADQYKAGFNTPNSEWMWETYHDANENLGVYGFFAYVGSNTPSSKGYKNIGSIDRGLIDAIPEGDARRWLFAVPKAGESGWSTSDSGRAKKGNFFDRIKNDYADVIDKSTYIFAYMSFKYRTITDRSIGCVCLMRAAEMIYNEAEARYMMGGQEDKVKSLLNEAVKPYQSGYSCTKSGAALLEEVKLYRRFDLWAEGRGWFDQKRWNEPMVRKGWNNGGNWHPEFAGSGATGGNYGVADRNAWTFCIPSKETDYNKLIGSNIEPDNWTASN